MAGTALVPKDTKEDDHLAAERHNDAQVMQGLNEYLRRYAPQHTTTKDILANRFQIEMGQPIPEYNVKTARAYSVTDTQESGKRFFAHVCESGTFQRHALIAALKPIKHPNILPVVASGTVEMSQTGAERFVIVYERPSGRTIADLLSATTGPLNELFLRERIIAPLAAAIQQFSELGFSHGSINPQNIYYGETLVVGPCVAEPCGYSQPFYFEPYERMLAANAGKGEGSPAQDYYALTVLVIYLLFGPNHFAAFTPQSLITSINRDGPYNALTRMKDHPESFFDFFRALLTSTSEEKSARYLKLWLDGKRYTVLAPGQQTDMSRPYEYGTIYATGRKQLANLFSNDWNQMIEPLQNGHLAQWSTTSLRSKEISDNMSRISKSVRDMTGKNDAAMAEQLMRVILLLDPLGPIRIGPLSMFVDGMDSLCAELFVNKAQAELSIMAKFIEMNSISFWIDIPRKDNPISTSANAVMVKVERLRTVLRNTGLGYGLERMLYDLNPDMPCQSPLLAGRHVTTLPALLKALDAVAPALARDQDSIDRHIAAFITSKLGSMHEVKLHELAAIPALANHKTLLSLKLLCAAQHKAGRLNLPGLTHWIAVRILPAIDNIRSKSLRGDIKEFLVKHAQSGDMTKLEDLLLSEAYGNGDRHGFTKASALYQNNAIRIVSYSRYENIDVYSSRIAYKIAKGCAYIALLCSILMTAG